MFNIQIAYVLAVADGSRYHVVQTLAKLSQRDRAQTIVVTCGSGLIQPGSRTENDSGCLATLWATRKGTHVGEVGRPHIMQNRTSVSPVGYARGRTQITSLCAATTARCRSPEAAQNGGYIASRSRGPGTEPDI